jgi:polar amino acid transport system substrate-binding protein
MMTDQTHIREERLMKLDALSILLPTIAMVATAPQIRATVQLSADMRQALAPTGKLRVGVYSGSPTSMIKDRSTGEPRGLAFDLGKEFAQRLSVAFEVIELTQIADVLDALKRGDVDFTVTNASPARATDVDFTAPILAVELGYLVPPHSTIAAIADVDRLGIRVGVTAGGSSHATLLRELMHATVVPSPSVTAGIEMLAGRKVDIYATNKAILFEMSDQIAGSRVLDGRWGTEVFAIGIPKGRDIGMPVVRRFAEEARSEGLVRRVAARAGLRGVLSVE